MKPKHEVGIPAYRIDVFKVTNGAFAEFVRQTGHKPPSHWSGGKIPRASRTTR